METEIKLTELIGTDLRTRDFKTGAVFFEPYKPKLEYAWDTGKAIGRFLAEIKKGRLAGTHCSKCQRTLIPPRIFCEKCFRDIDKWVTLKDTGIIQTFSVSYVTWDVKRLEKPQIPAVIAIDGATPGYGILHLIKTKDPKTLRIGQRVKAVWKPARQRKGAITDIRYFEVIG
ncbi:MAG: Zn-ribbon domain-containing OB-fold protein [Elusimicrobiota bacterium]